MKTIAIHATAYKRPEVTRIAWTSLNRVREQFRERGFDSYVLVGVSEVEHAEIAKEFGFEYIHVANTPVGLKFNKTMRAIVMRKDYDYVMEFCSDNILRTDYVDRVIKAMDAGHDYICLNQFYICHMDSGRVLEFGNATNKRGGLSNVGRINSRKNMDMAWRKLGHVYDIRANRRLDASYFKIFENVFRMKPFVIKDDTPLLIDLKDKDSMNIFASFEAFPRCFPSTNVVGEFPELPAKFQTDNTTTSWPQQENSEVTLSEFTSPPLKAQAHSKTTSATQESAQPSEKTPPTKRKPSSSSRRRRRVASQEAGTSSTPPPKTTTDDAKS